MRICSQCQALDRVHITGELCTCGADKQSLTTNGYPALDQDHAADCARVSHFVIRDWPFPKIYRPHDLMKADPDNRAATHGYLLPQRFRSKWRLVERPSRPNTFARVRTLCRDCIIEEMAISARIREYEDRKRELSEGAQAKGWAPSLASQDGF